MDESSQRDTNRRVPTTALYLIGALAAIVGLCGAMLVITLVTLARLEGAERQVAHLDRAKHAAHIVEAQVREQYIHQAHSIIELSLSRLSRYRRVVKTTHQAIARLQRLTRRPADREKADELARLARLNDQQFREKIVPAVRGRQREAVIALHARAVPIVTRVTQVNAELSRILNQRSSAARARADALRRRTRTMAIICFGAAFFVALLVAVQLTRRIGGRIVVLRRGALRLADGDLSTRISLGGNDEFAELAGTFNQMATDLDRHQQRLLRAERLASIGQVAAGVAHEINNPLGVILGYVKLLRRKLGDDHQETVQIIEDETRLCQRIVDSLLELARPSKLNLEPIDLGSLAHEVVDRLGESGKLEEVDIALPTLDDPVIAEGDEEKIRQVLQNLIVNGAEAAGAGGSVTIWADTRQGEAMLSVRDSGAGMPEQVRARVFEPFFTTKRSGVGLGLSIAQAIVDAHRGRLTMSCPDDGGTRATLCLPRPAREDRSG